jgi:hypothetical protein
MSPLPPRPRRTRARGPARAGRRRSRRCTRRRSTPGRGSGWSARLGRRLWRPSAHRAPRGGQRSLGHRVLCPSARAIGVVSLTITRWPLRRCPSRRQRLIIYTPSRDATPCGEMAEFPVTGTREAGVQSPHDSRPTQTSLRHRYLERCHGRGTSRRGASCVLVVGPCGRAAAHR